MKVFLCQGEIDFRTTQQINLKTQRNNYKVMEIIM